MRHIPYFLWSVFAAGAIVALLGIALDNMTMGLTGGAAVLLSYGILFLMALFVYSRWWWKVSSEAETVRVFVKVVGLLVLMLISLVPVVGAIPMYFWYKSHPRMMKGV